MSWNTCLLLVKPCSSEVSGSKISSFFFSVTLRKNYLPLISTNAAWSFGWSVLCETHCLLTLLLVGRLNQFSLCVPVCVALWHALVVIISGRCFKKTTKVREKRVFPVVSESQKPWQFMLEWLISKWCSSGETEVLKQKWWTR